MCLIAMVEHMCQFSTKYVYEASEAVGPVESRPEGELRDVGIRHCDVND